MIGLLLASIEQFSATLVQDGLTECDQPENNPLKYSATVEDWTRAMKKTDSEIHSFSHWAIKIHMLQDSLTE